MFTFKIDLEGSQENSVVRGPLKRPKNEPKL